MSAVLVLKMLPDEKISSLLSEPMDQRVDIYFPEEYVSSGEFTDTDVAWQGIHLLLTGSLDSGDFPASFILSGGRILGPSALASSTDMQKLGLGEIDRVLSRREVKEVEEYLDTITDDQLKETYLSSEDIIGEVYPGIWNANSESDFSALLLSFNAVKKFIARTSQKDYGLILHFA